MTVLSRKTTSGQPAWNVYVVNKSDRATTDYPMRGTAVMYKSTTPTKGDDILATLVPGNQVRITSTATFTVNVSRPLAPRAQRMTCAKVRYNGKEGYVNIGAIGKPTTQPDDVERRTIEASQTVLNQLKGIAKVGNSLKAGINIEVEGIGFFTDVATVSKVPERVHGREAKADIVMKDARGNALMYISHKKAGGAGAFQQYGGVSKKAGNRTNANLIYDDSEVQQYLNDLYTLYEDATMGVNSYEGNPFDRSGRITTGRIYRFVNSPTLIARSVFGPDYGGSFGIDNVHFIAQGDFRFRPYIDEEGDINFKMSFSERYEINGDIEDFSTGRLENPYRAVFVSRSEGGKNTETPRGTLRGIRTGIFNVNYLSGTAANIDAILASGQSFRMGL